MALCLSSSLSALWWLGRAMASDSHEGSGGDTPGEGNAVETRSRHASCEEEPPAHTPSSPASSGAADRRFSLPTELPVSSDILAGPVPEYSPRPRNSVVVSLGRLAPQSDSWYRSCPHRTHVWEGGPPCYLCSMLDLPPKYRRREAHGWHRFKEKLTQLSHATVSPLQRGRSLRQDPPAAVFTINEWRPSDASEWAPVEEVPVSLSAAPDHRQTQERDNPVFDAHDSLESGVTRGSYLSGVHQHSSTTTSLSVEGVSFVPLPPLPASTAAHNPPFFPPQDAPQEAPSKKYNRRL